jgi:hypothetical protein
MDLSKTNRRLGRIILRILIYYSLRLGLDIPLIINTIIILVFIINGYTNQHIMLYSRMVPYVTIILLFLSVGITCKHRMAGVLLYVYGIIEHLNTEYLNT